MPKLLAHAAFRASGHFADTHGLTGYEPNLTPKFGFVDGKSTPFWGASGLWTDKYTTSQRKGTLTIIEIYGQSNVFTDRSKAETL